MIRIFLLSMAFSTNAIAQQKSNLYFNQPVAGNTP
jgi:hypothetical protein